MIRGRDAQSLRPANSPRLRLHDALGTAADDLLSQRSARTLAPPRCCKRKAALEEEERRRAIEAERAERERQKQLEQAQVDRLLEDADAFRQAAEIRKYVEALRISQSSNSAASTVEFEQWSGWALAQADRIDPALGDVFLKAMDDKRDG
jgi:hypothetical protein